MPSFTREDQRKPRKSLSDLPISGIGIIPRDEYDAEYYPHNSEV